MPTVNVVDLNNQVVGSLDLADAVFGAEINESLLSTLAACGDVERNVLCCPAPIADAVRDQLQADALRWAAHCAPRSSASTSATGRR